MRCRAMPHHSASLSLILLFFLASIATADEKAWYEFRVSPIGAVSSYEVKISGMHKWNPLYRSAITSAFTEASRRWRTTGASDIPLKAKVRFKDLPAGMISKHKFENDADIVIELSTVSDVKWHVYGTDIGSNSGMYDLQTVVLREIYSCLMFHGNLRARNGDGGGGWIRDGVASRFDRFVVDADGCSVIELGKSQLGRALTSEVYFLIPSTNTKVRLYTPSKFIAVGESTTTIPASVYHLACTNALDDCTKSMTNVMQPNIVKGRQYRRIPPIVLRMQEAYLNSTLEGAPKCSASTRDGTSGGGSNSDTNANRVKNVLGLPLWAFGLCVVASVILLFILLWWLCTAGAKAKQSEGSSCFKHSIFSGCCTGIDTERELEREAELYYANSDALDRISFSTLDRRSIDALRRTGDLWPAPIPPEPALLPLSQPLPVAESETVLPGHLQTRIPSNMGQL